VFDALNYLKENKNTKVVAHFLPSVSNTWHRPSEAHYTQNIGPKPK